MNGTDLTWRVLTTTLGALALVGLMLPPAEPYEGGGAGPPTLERQVRQCTYIGKDYTTCYNELTKTNKE